MYAPSACVTQGGNGSCRRVSCVSPLGKSPSARSYAACERGLERAYSASVESAVLMPRTLPRAFRACSVPAMDLDLVGRRAAVMASSDGIGKAIACALAREGVHVMMCGRDDAKLAAAMDEAKAIAREGAQVAGERIDLGTRARARRCWSSPPRPHSAASTSSSRTRAGRPRVRCSRSTTRPGRRPSNRYCCRSRAARAPPCRTSRPPTQGRIVSIASSSIKATLPTLGFSNVFRPGIHGLVKTLAEELGPKGITVNLIAPGKIDTARVRWLDGARAERSGTSADDVRAASEREIPLGRYGDPMELAEVAVFLCSKAGRYVTGTATLVDGGVVRAL